MTTASKPRPRVKPERHVAIGEASNGVASLTITTIEQRVRSGAKITVYGYFLHRLPADFGLGFRFEKCKQVEGEPDAYDVNIDLQRGYHSCTCKGNTYHGHCKHVESLLALIRSGKIDVPAPKQQPISEPCEFDDP